MEWAWPHLPNLHAKKDSGRIIQSWYGILSKPKVEYNLGQGILNGNINQHYWALERDQKFIYSSNLFYEVHTITVLFHVEKTEAQRGLEACSWSWQVLEPYAIWLGVLDLSFFMAPRTLPTLTQMHGRILRLPLISSVPSGKLVNFLEPQFPHLQSGRGRNSTYLAPLTEELRSWKCMQNSAWLSVRDQQIVSSVS